MANFLIRLIDENQPLWAVGSPSPTSYPQAAVNTVDSTASLVRSPWYTVSTVQSGHPFLP